MSERAARGLSLHGRAGLHWDAQGLIPGIVQDAATGEVLMLGYLDAEALDATLETGLAHFHSRSRGRLWKKGETSGNTLAVCAIRVDCDGDALLIAADPSGPTCHTGATSCFDDTHLPAGVPAQGFAWLETLWATIVERSDQRPPGSYTARLLDGGVDAASRKVVEEATEVLLAAKNDAVAEAASVREAAAPVGVRQATQAALAAETADLLYHMLVLAAERGVSPSAVIDVLRSRHAR
jgi:phosphoribosyl-AMP cyclohydrolase / phosphoribosyl-ATP pyrophosphohydrolase